MYKAHRFFNAGDNEFHRWGKKAQEKVAAYLTPNKDGFYSIPADGGKYWTIGTSEGKYGTFARHMDTYFSVNKAGNVWAKVGTPKADAFVDMINDLLRDMKIARQGTAEDEE